MTTLTAIILTALIVGYFWHTSLSRSEGRVRRLRTHVRHLSAERDRLQGLVDAQDDVAWAELKRFDAVLTERTWSPRIVRGDGA